MQSDTKSFANIEFHANKCVDVCCRGRNRCSMSSNVPRDVGDFDCCDMTCNICEDEDFVQLGDQEFMSESKDDKVVDVIDIGK